MRTLSWQGALVVDTLAVTSPRTKTDTLAVTSPRTKTDEHGRFTDDHTLDSIRQWASRLVRAVAAPPHERLALVAAVIGPYGIDLSRFGELPAVVR